MSIKKERVPAIEYMRGISMLGVVGIHVGSQYLMNNPTPNLQLLALYEIVTRFSVPIFFFISAFIISHVPKKVNACSQNIAHLCGGEISIEAFHWRSLKEWRPFPGNTDRPDWKDGPDWGPRFD